MRANNFHMNEEKTDVVVRNTNHWKPPDRQEHKIVPYFLDIKLSIKNHIEDPAKTCNKRSTY